MLRKKPLLKFGAAGAVTTALLFGILAVGCGTDNAPQASINPPPPPEDTTGITPPPVTPTLSGTWAGTTHIDTSDVPVSLSIDSNFYMLSLDGIDREKGAFMTDGDSVTFTPAQIPGALFPALAGIDLALWYTKDEFRAVVNEVYLSSGAGPISDTDFEDVFGSFFKPVLATFTLTDDNLSITYDDGITLTLVRQIDI
ncbi:MAG: hypothetical protein LBB74_09630 [Chitinispirillales bacterium]|jgi:hypothetical protein|nr:hypothetical protein [Chitinispirillales bacterium]